MIEPEALPWSRRGTSNDPRDVAIYLARRFSGKTLAEIGQAFGMENSSSVGSVVNRMKYRIERTPRLRQRVAALERRLSGGKPKA